MGEILMIIIMLGAPGTGKERKIDSLSSGERKGKSPNQLDWGCRTPI